MDLIFLPQKRGPFTIEVGYFDSVLEIKEKVEKYQGIPVSEQSLFFNGELLPDDGDVASRVLLHNSRINLIIASEEMPVRLRVKIPTPETHFVEIEMDRDHRVSKLKRTILELETTLASAKRPLALYFNGQELKDSIPIGEYKVSDGVEIEARFRPRKKTLQVIVESKCGSKRIPVNLSPWDKVEELRKECQRLKEERDFPLPPEYFLIHKQAAMEEGKSFRSLKVGKDDIIVVFPGRVTAGFT